MPPKRKLSRRSFLASVAGGPAGVVMLFVAGRAEALQRPPSGCSDSDPLSRGGDPGGYVRSCSRGTGRTDNDPSDPVNGGRGDRNRRCNDSGSASRAKNAGEGRRC